MPEQTVSVHCIAGKLKVSPETVIQFCDTGQIPEDAYVIQEPGTAWKTYRFYESKVFKAIPKPAVPEEVAKETKPVKPKSKPKTEKSKK